MNYGASLHRPQNYYGPIVQGIGFLPPRAVKTGASGKGSPWETEATKFFFTGGSSRPLQFYDSLHDTHLQVLKQIMPSLSEAEALELLWEGVGGYLPWWKRRRYDRQQQGAAFVKYKIHLPKPRALAGVPTTPKQRALVTPKTGPAVPGAKGAGSSVSKFSGAIKALSSAAETIFPWIVPPPPRPTNITHFSGPKLKYLDLEN